MSTTEKSRVETDLQREPLAIVGISALYPGSVEVGGFWRDIMSGRDLIGEIPPHYWLVEDFYDPDPFKPDKTYCKRGAFLDKVDFDPLAFGIPPANLSSTDTCQLLALMVAKQVLDDAAKNQFKELDRERISVILGVAAGLELVGEMAGRLQRPVWVKSLREHGLPEAEVQAICDRIVGHSVKWTESTFPGLLGNVVTGRIANRFDLGGTNCTTDAACASSFSALSMAANELYLGDSDLVITGGVDTTNDPFLYMCFSKTPALSFNNECRPFAESADGTMLGEGLGMIAIKRLADAERDNDRIYAVIRGLGTSSDGRSKSVYAPRPSGQARALRKAYSAAGCGPETVELVEAHGTGTMAGDVAEFEGLSQVFDGVREERQWCALGSIKSQLGHTKAAAGVAGLLKVALSLQHRVLPPTLKVDRPDPKLEIEQSAFYLNAETRPWIRGDAHPRRGAISSFGFGGTNFHVVLEQYRGPARSAWRQRSAPSELVLLTADDPTALVARCRELSGQCEDNTEPLSSRGSIRQGLLRFLARESQEGFDAASKTRLALVCADEADLEKKLEQAAAAIDKRPDAALALPTGLYYDPAPVQGDVAFLFSGQGSQYVGMGADLAMAFDAAREPWDAAADDKLDGQRALHELVYPKPVFSDEERQVQEAELRATEWAQPSLGLTSLSILTLLEQVGLKPACVGGHSFGEVTALCAAGALTREEMLRVARRRGELMAEAAATPGSMTAVVHPVDDLRALLADLGSEVVIANLNGPRQTVLSGTTAAIEAIEPELAARSIQFKRLPVATAFHSPVVEHAAGPFGAFLSEIDFATPRVPVFANSEAAPYPSEGGAAAVREILANQIARPVRFSDEVQAMWDAGARIFVEVGPGSVLTGLVGQILEGQPHLAVNTDRRGQHGLTALHHSLGRLAAAGIPLQLAPLWAAYAPVEDPRLRVKPKLTVPIDGVNVGKIYPPEGGAEALLGPNAAQAAPTSDQQSHQEPHQDVPKMSADKPATPPTPPQPQLAAPQAPMAAPAPLTAQPAGWLQAYQELQRQTAEAHAAYQRSMAESHVAFLRTAEATSMHLHAVLTGQPLPEQASLLTQVQPSLQPPPQPQLAPQPILATQPLPVAPLPQPVAAPQPTFQPAPVQPVAPVGASVATPVAAPVADQPAPAVDAGGNGSAIEAIDFKELLLEVVAEKTGYPEEILSMEMGLESDLGIDSIKRVEILSALQERAPGLPEVDASQIPNMQTLGQVLEFLEEYEGGGNGNGNGNGNGGRTLVDPSVSTTPAAKAAPVERKAVAEVLIPADGTSLLEALEQGSRVVLIDDKTGVALALAEMLKARGLAPEVADELQNGAALAALIDLGGLCELADEDAALAVNRRAFKTAQQVAGRFGEAGGLFVTVQDTGGDFGLAGSDRAYLAGLAALAKTAALEWDKAAVKAVDLERGERAPEALAEALLQELAAGGPEREVGLHADGRRVTLGNESYDVSGGAAVLGGEDVLVVSGGARGVTAATLRELARRHGCKLVLLGRTELSQEPACCADAADDAALKRALIAQASADGETIAPAELGPQVGRILAVREIRATLEALKQCGSRARYLQVDVTDAEAVRRALVAVRNDWGPITGVIHGAGVLADKRIADKTPEQFDRVFDTKVQGLRGLLRATADDPLKVVCLFSSVAGRYGNVGQSDYAMANEILSRAAAREARRRGDGCVVRAIAWGPWEGGMVSPSLRGHFAAMGIPLIPLEEGARMLAEELSAGEGRPVEVVIGSPPPQGLTAKAAMAMAQSATGDRLPAIPG